MAVYVVSGWIRHGTSMMMRCLEAGGMDVARSMAREVDASARFHDDEYEGNPAYYELTRQDIRLDDLRSYEGRVIKLLRGGVANLPPGDFRIIYMRRDGEETRQSAQALFNRALPAEWAGMVDKQTTAIVGKLRARGDVALIEVRYRDVIDSPLKAFERIRHAGWPIDAQKAAAVVDPHLCRYRRELLDEGV